MKYIKLIAIVATLFLTLYAKDYRALVRVKNIVASNGEVHKISDFGNYYAILIYVQDYENLPRLQTPKKDVEDIANILKNRYGFKEVKIVANPKNSDELIEILDKYKRKLSQNDNLLIYYAGHGSKNGYWQLKKAKKDSRVGWIPIKEAINSTLKDMLSKHILVVADSCYSGYLTRDGVNISTLSKNDKLYYTKLYRLKSRNVLTSGGLQPVLDKDPSNPNHSIFANAFLKILKNNKTPIFSVEEKFPKIKRYVKLNSDQTPLYADVRYTGHQDGGDFIFVDRGAINTTEDIKSINTPNKNLILCRKFSCTTMIKKALNYCSKVRGVIGKAYVLKAKYKLAKEKSKKDAILKEFKKLNNDLLSKCDSGNSDACNLLSYYFYYEYNYKKSVQFAKRACDSGNYSGCFQLGGMYYDGFGVKKDYNKAYNLYKQACEDKYTFSCIMLGWMYRNGKGVKVDLKKSVKLYKKACDSGDSLGCTYIGYSYEKGYGIKKDLKKAHELYKKACDSGDSLGCNNLFLLKTLQNP